VRLAAERRGRDPDPRWGLHRPPHPVEFGALAAIGALAGSARLWPDAVRRGARLARPAHPGRSCCRGDAPGPGGLGRRPPRCAVLLRDRRGGGCDRAAQELAGDAVIAVTGGTIARQCLDMGLLDEVAIDLVPVVMGAGNRPFFGELSSEDVLLGNPTVCVQGDRVTHLVFPVLKALDDEP